MKNVEYEVMDAAKLKQEWTNTFDFATTFDSIHDQARPDLSLKGKKMPKLPLYFFWISNLLIKNVPKIIIFLDFGKLVILTFYPTKWNFAFIDIPTQ